jgi:hypothetical protein
MGDQGLLAIRGNGQPTQALVFGIAGRRQRLVLSGCAGHLRKKNCPVAVR